MAQIRLDLTSSGFNTGAKIPVIFPQNTHICHFYRTKEDLLEVMVPYFSEGLAQQEFCLWGVTAPLTVEEAKKALASFVHNFDVFVQNNQIEIFDISGLYGAGQFDALQVRNGFLRKVEESLSQGWKGFRCDGITSGVKPRDWKNFQIYEHEVTRMLPGSVTALCSYNMADLTPQQMTDAAETHSSTLVKRGNEWYVIDVDDMKKN